MGIETKITNRLDSNNVQVEIRHTKSGRSKYFKVPANKADSFMSNYKKNDKKSSIFTNTAFVTAILGGVLLSSAATKKIKSTTLKWLINTSAGIAGAVCSVFAGSKYIETNQNKLLKQHNAQEIYLNA